MKVITLLLASLLALGGSLAATSSPWTHVYRAAPDADWAWSASLGWLNDRQFPYIYSPDHGWLYQVGSEEKGLWFFDAQLKAWWYTSAVVYQQHSAKWTYHATADTWLQYIGRPDLYRLWQSPGGSFHTDQHVVDYGAYVQAMRLAGLPYGPIDIEAFKENYVDRQLAGRAIIP